MATESGRSAAQASGTSNAIDETSREFGKILKKLRQVRELSEQHNLKMLSYILSMAEIEAIVAASRASSNGGDDNS